MRHLTLVLFFVFFLAGCTFEPESKSIDIKINASGEIEVKPDIAQFLVTANCVNKDVKASSACVASKADEIIELLSTLGINKKDFHSSGISLRKEYHWEKSTKIFNGYSASVSIMIIVRDIKKLNRLLGTLMTHEHLALGRLSYSHSKLEALKNDAYLNALENAKTLAQRLQTKLGGKSIEIVEINNTNEPLSATPQPVKMLEQSASRSGTESININVGTLVLKKNLNVQFRIRK